MAKKKKKAQIKQLPLSEENYIKSGKVRGLPVYKCFINNDWEETGMANALVMRQHINNNVTIGIYLVDLLCAGLKETYFVFNIEENEFMLSLTKYNNLISFEECNYELIHNIIYGGIEFADEFNIRPHQDFSLTSLILEKDNEHIPLIDIEFGRDGIPVLIADSNNPKIAYYHNQLKKYAGEGNYIFLEDEEELFDDNDFDDPDDWEEDDWEEDDWIYFFEDIEDCETEEELNETLLSYIDAVQYIYEKVVVAPEAATKKLTAEKLEINAMTITYDILKNDNFGNEPAEIKETETIFTLMLEETDFDKLTNLIKRLQKAIAKWPNNPIFLNYLYNVYQLLNNKNLAKQTATLLNKNFPNYLFGKINFAYHLIEEGKIDKVPDVFRGEYNLKSIYPERDVFHIQEFLAFNTLMCLYFLKKEDVYMANLYRNMIFQLDLPDEINLNDHLFFMLDLEICNQVREIIEETLNNEKKKTELIAALIN